MDKQFTASEVRDSAIAVVARDMEYEAEMLRAYADLLEAQEKAVPVMVVNHVSSAEHDLPIGMKLYAHPAPSDAERLAEALRKIAREPIRPWPDPFAHSPEAFARAVHASWCDMNRTARQALAAHSAQAQPPAASVTDAMQELADKYHELLWAVARKFPGETRHETALRYIREAECQEAALAAQENPNG